MEQVKEKTPEQKTKEFYKTVEAGDLALFNILQEAVAVFGFTKVGKTTSCHILCGSTLRAGPKNTNRTVEDITIADLIYRPTTNRYNTAKIGFKDGESQTQIPNIFETSVVDRITNKRKRILLLDQPGYGDLCGFHRIFSNGYFHYRTFSKTPKLKFILAIQFGDIRGSADKLKKTISNFIDLFVEYNSLKTTILRATSLLITKVDKSLTIQNLTAALRSITQDLKRIDSSLSRNCQQIINEILGGNRLFCIYRPQRNNQSTGSTQPNPILQQIYQRTIFWERPYQNNIVNMNDIKFSVSKQIIRELKDTTNQIFRQDFDCFMELTQQRLDQIIVLHSGSLKNIVNLLINDAMSTRESHNFLAAMETFRDKFFQFHSLYNRQRQSTIANLFRSFTHEQIAEMGLNNQQLLREMRSLYFIKKFSVLQQLQRVYHEFVLNRSYQRSIQQLQNLSRIFLRIFEKFNILRLNPIDTVNKINKYSYIIQRLIEQYKIMTLILFQDPTIKQSFQKLNRKTFTQDIFRALQDKFFHPVLGQICVTTLKSIFVANFNLQQLTIINCQIFDFFQSARRQINQRHLLSMVQNNSMLQYIKIAFQLPTTLTYQQVLSLFLDNQWKQTNLIKLQQKVQVKVLNLLLQYKKAIFAKDRISNEVQKKYLLNKLYTYRVQYYGKLTNQYTRQQYSVVTRPTKFYISTIVTLTKAIATILTSYNLFDRARQCYNSINDADNVFKVYDLEAKIVMDNPVLYRKLLIRYAKQAKLYERRQLCLQCCQKAYALSEEYDELEEASSIIVKQCTQYKYDSQGAPQLRMIASSRNAYIGKMESNEYCQDFSSELKTSIQSVIYG